jgi:hypothetical protein
MTMKCCDVCGMNIFESMEISVNEKYFHFACFMQNSEQIKKEMIEGKK